MIRFLSGLLLIAAAALLAYTASPIQYYFQPKQQRLVNTWQADLNHLKQDPQLNKVFNQIAQVELHFTDPQVAEEFKNLTPPIQETTSHGYILKISITRWIEASEYGYVIQHEFFDQNQDKLHEFGRTYRIGLIF